MNLQGLLKDLAIKNITGVLTSDIKGIAYDSRLVGPDFLFVAVRGFTFDGHTFIKDAIDRGAAAIVTEYAVEKTGAIDLAAQGRTAFIEVSDSREALALISAAYYGYPSTRLSLIGITGTNGKTTTSFITKSIIEAGGNNTGLLGTICYMTGKKPITSVNTTPESLDLQRYLNEMVNNNITYSVVEVSSHAMTLKRIDGCLFNVAAFTNFTQDHLDFHKTMDAYFNTKSRLFSYLREGGTAVLNTDDPALRQFAKTLNCNVITCGIEQNAMIRAEKIEVGKRIRDDSGTAVRHGLAFDACTPAGRFSVRSSLTGRMNVYNILLSIGIAHALGINREHIRKGISEALPVEGRFESIDRGQDFYCIVDYAHTEDALRKLIEEAKLITEKKVITVFGCGGDRDRSKRSQMGHAADTLSDHVVVTSDNPRSEDLEEIIKDIVKGISSEDFSVIPDREEAIRYAILKAETGDTVLVAGKGHEDYQEIKGIRHHFSDREVIIKILKEITG
ncbi:MAG: UDP-N-acetylmuramoyl-L-alanyl-D-glutamate--2,6-diaminopimelate ligase [Nitrospiraceae bacterium]|nr:MAG: UDP-N-acetylmuramoyl-L-alanyl-D-glutamate--2,6-diaminopimelate ligase [Nitrospiraceae bacterium]